METNESVEFPVKEMESSSNEDVFDLKNLEQSLPSVQHHPGKLSLNPKTLHELRYLKIRRLMQLRRLQRLSEGAYSNRAPEDLTGVSSPVRAMIREKLKRFQTLLDSNNSQMASSEASKTSCSLEPSETPLKFMGPTLMEKDGNNVYGTSEPTHHGLETKFDPRARIKEIFDVPLFRLGPSVKASDIRETFSYVVTRELSKEKRALILRGLSLEDSDEHDDNSWEQEKKRRLAVLNTLLGKEELSLSRRVQEVREKMINLLPQMHSASSSTACKATEISTPTLPTTPPVAADGNLKSIREMMMEAWPLNH